MVTVTSSRNPIAHPPEPAEKVARDDLQRTSLNGAQDIAAIRFDSARANLFSPLFLADKFAFVFLLFYFFFWPVWYVAEWKLSVRIWDFRIEHLILVVIVFFSCGSFIRHKPGVPGSWSLLLLLSYASLTLMWSVDTKEGFLVLLNIASIYPFSAILARDRRRQQIAMYSFLSGLILMVCIGLKRAEVIDITDLRLLFPLGIDSNQFAVLGAMATVILATSIMSSTGGKSLFRFGIGLALGLLITTAVVLSGSRTGVVALLTGVSIAFFVRKDSSGNLRIWHPRLTLIPVLGLFVLLIVQPLMHSRSSNLFERYKEGFFQGDLSGRDMVWLAGANYLISKPEIFLFGGGLGSFDESVVDYLNRPLYKVAAQMGASNPVRPFPYFAAHNDFIRLSGELGTTGLVLLLIFYIRVGQACLRRPGEDGATNLPLALFVTVILGGMALDLVSFPVYPIVLALLMAPRHAGSTQ